MPRIADTWVNVAAYIYSSLDAARAGDRFGASGFIVGVPLEEMPEMAIAYVVTNKHVIKSPSGKKRTPVIRLNRKDGEIECVPTTSDQWTCHPHGDDVAVFPLDIDLTALVISQIEFKDFVTPDLIADEDIGIGDDTVMVGRFVSHEGKQRNSPSVRFGNIAMMNGETVYNAELGINQESFLVETRSLPGYSGSAVLVYSPCSMMDMSRKRYGRARRGGLFGTGKLDEHDIRALVDSKGPYLLGIDWCHIQRKAPILSRDGRPMDDGWYVEENTGMAGVVPAWRVADILKSEEFVMQRKESSDQIAREHANSSVSLDSAEPHEPTQTTPAGAEIPIPSQEQFLDDLTKASRRIK